MLFKRLCYQAVVLMNYKNPKYVTNFVRQLHISLINLSENKHESKAIAERLNFKNVETKTRDTYLEMLKIFVNRDSVYRRGHVEFIYSALKHMEDFGVHRDLEVYRALIDILPKGKFVATNILQAEFMHYPKQQQCVIDLLEQMEDNGVMPDFEMEDLLVNIFGRRAYPLRKYWRMMYWMPKFKNLSPWPIPNPLPDDSLELAKIVIQRINTVDYQSKITVYQTKDIKDSIDDTWIVSGQSKAQQNLLNEKTDQEPLYVEGAFKVWLKDKAVDYFILRGTPKAFTEEMDDMDDVSDIKISFYGIKPPERKCLKVIPSVHEQEDGILYAVCATGSSSKDSLLSWIRHLEIDGNPILAKVPIVFTLRSGSKEIAPIQHENPSTTKEEQSVEQIVDKP